MLVKAGSSAVEEQGKPGSAGVPVGTAQDTLTAPFNDLAAVEELFRRYPGADCLCHCGTGRRQYGRRGDRTPVFCKGCGPCAIRKARC